MEQGQPEAIKSVRNIVHRSESEALRRRKYEEDWDETCALHVSEGDKKPEEELKKTKDGAAHESKTEIPPSNKLFESHSLRAVPASGNENVPPERGLTMIPRWQFKCEFTWNRTLGTGGQGFVQLWTRDKDQKAFAIKTVVQTYLLDKKILAQLQCAKDDVAIVKQEEWTIEPLRQGERIHHYSAMEYCDGGDISMLQYRMVKSRVPCPESFLWHMYSQLAGALAFLHSGHDRKHSTEEWIPIIHRDIKAENILLQWTGVDQYPNCKLADFEHARFDDGKIHKDAVGTPMNAPPEQWKDPAQPIATAKGDVWALGSIVQQVACGMAPADSSYRMDRDHEGEKTMPRLVVRVDHEHFGYSKELQLHMQLALTFDSEKRPTAACLFKTLKAFLNESKADKPDTEFLNTVFTRSPEKKFHGKFFVYNESLPWNESYNDLKKDDYVLAGRPYEEGMPVIGENCERAERNNADD